MELLDDFANNSNKQVPVINKLLQVSVASKDQLVDDCIQVLSCKGIFKNHPESIHLHPQLCSRMLSFFQHLMLMCYQGCISASQEARYVSTLYKAKLGVS